MGGKMKYGVSVLAMTVCGALAAPAIAADGEVLEEIIVTATKRAENIQDVPMAITAMTGDKLDVTFSGGADIRALSARMPSVYAESSFGRTFPRFYIRGLGNPDFDLNASQPVSMVYDGVVLENPVMKGFPVFDLERIEVLRGPQGTLFGRNTPAGLLKFESKKPSQETNGYVSAGYGRFNTVDLEGAFGGAINDTVSIRGSFLFQQRDDWVDNLHTGEDDVLGGFEEFAGRFQVLMDPSENLSMLFNYHTRSLEGTARVFRANIIKPGEGGFVDNFSRSSIWQDGHNTQDLKANGLSATITYDIDDDTTLTSITALEKVKLFTRGDIDGGYGASFWFEMGPGFIPFTAESADGIPDLDQFTQELRLATTTSGGVDVQAGVFYFNEEQTIESFSYSTLFGGGQDGYAVQNQSAKALALFGALSYDVSDKLTLSAGARVSNDKKDFSAERTMSPLAFLGIGAMPEQSVNTSDTVVTWDASATYAYDESTNFYARVAKGFRAPSIQGRVLFAAGDGTDPTQTGISIADTETIYSIEAGMKADIMDGRARLNVATYYYQINDQQITAVGGFSNVNTLLNSNKTKGSGFEVDFEANLTENVFMTTGLSYNNSTMYDKDLAVAPCGGGCTVTDPLNNDGLALINGNSLPNSPKWVFNTTLRWSKPISDEGEIFIYTDWAYRSKVNFFLYSSVEFQDNSLLEGGLRFGYARNDGTLEAAFYGRNITGDLSLTGGIDFNNLTGFVNEPTTYGFEITKRF